MMLQNGKPASQPATALLPDSKNPSRISLIVLLLTVPPPSLRRGELAVVEKMGPLEKTG